MADTARLLRQVVLYARTQFGVYLMFYRQMAC